jgi:1-acyl-sn-glycerol-3-phosphate acyltransferase
MFLSLSTIPHEHYINAMGTVLMLLTIAGSLLVWDFFLKVTSVICRPLARKFLNARVTHMAGRLMRLATVYGRLTVRLDPKLTQSLPNPCLVIANHQSVADIAVLLAALRHHSVRFVAKRELARGFPAVSEVLRIQRHALIDRHGGYRGTARALATLGRRAQAGQTPVVFPEGTRSRSGRVGTFQTGGVRTILEITKLPIVGVAIDGGYRFAAMTNLVKGLRGITYRVRLVAVVDPGSTKHSIQEAVRQVHGAVVRQLQEWHAEDAES